jgi:hypothetical protein
MLQQTANCFLLLEVLVFAGSILDFLCCAGTACGGGIIVDVTDCTDFSDEDGTQMWYHATSAATLEISISPATVILSIMSLSCQQRITPVRGFQNS